MTSDSVASASVADFPVELADTIKDFQGSLSDLEAVLRPLLVSSRSDLHGGDNSTLTALEKARLDCLSAFAMNSLVWVWMRTKGINPKDTEVKSELDRVKKTMARLKEIQDQEKRGKVSCIISICPSTLNRAFYGQFSTQEIYKTQSFII